MSFIQLKRSTLLLCATLAVQVSAAPAADATVEIIPGPGLPSLQSLGLTSADIFRMSAERSVTARNEVETSLTKRIDTTCQNIAGHTVSAANAAACVTFLRNLGTQACGVNGDNVIFCQAGDAAIGGSNVSGGPSASSFCSDVAIGAQNILNACTMSNGQVEGFAAANGNSFLVVSIEPPTGA
ncbi:hypothetical protein CPC08DRAFT_789407 [Agrocybe pediades]|nr:hypothetical protein CPC08DRAFT_789407 [Agrocybe pediades]